jgi:TetR/AcrR family transcriptional regulator, regulator of autoinduction and epiphytic fitness
VSDLDQASHDAIERAVAEYLSQSEASFPNSEDGRHLRREHNQKKVIDALVDLFVEGSSWPTVSDVAAKAGISERSIFRYFDDMDDLVVAAIDSCVREALPYSVLPYPRPVDPRERLALLARARGRLFRHIMPISMASRAQVARSSRFAASIRKVRDLLRFQIATIFDVELSQMGSNRVKVLASLDVIFSFDTWYLLREIHGHSDDETADICVFMASSTLGLG